ncbi:hypothetical protein [Phocaeicola coprophilus]|uniref:hypothetical protein n=1 Tax=Phocaeicola coprophilus TaxID=387090 RepID=UPI003991F3D6
MKKKFIAVSVLICALALGSTTLTSCVDDNESASVTAIRDAKAAQLNALANYQQAQADAEKIVAEAEAAIRNAEAKWNEIQNSLQELELEKAQATLATEIEAAQTKAEAELLAQQALLEQAKAELIKVENATDLMTKNRINNLIAAADAIMNGGKYTIYETDIYYDYYGNPIVSASEGEVEINKDESLMGVEAGVNVGLKYQLINKKAERVKAEYDLTDTKLKIAEYVRKEKINLAVDQALLAEYQKYSNTDKETAEKAANEAKAKLNGLQNTLDQAEAVEIAEAAKINAAYTAILATEVEKFLNANSDFDEGGTYAVVTREAVEAETVTVTHDDGTVEDATPNYAWTGTYRNIGTATNPDYIKDTRVSAKEQIIVDEEALAAEVTKAARDLDVAQTNYDAAVKVQTEGLKDAALVKDAPGYQAWDFNNDSGLDLTTATYKDLKDATAAAQKAYDKEATQANRNALDRAEADEATYVAYFDVDDTALENAKEAKAAIDALNTLLTGDAFKAYTAAYEAYIAAHDANVASATATLKAQHNYDVQDDLATTLANVAAGYTDWAEEINTKEKAINNAEKNIANMTDNGTTTGGYTEASRQAYIDALDVEIARLEKEISIKQAQYDSYMSQVEALINGEETPEVPETPEEGGEETPAE